MTEKSREQKLRMAADLKGLIAHKGKQYPNFPSGWMICDKSSSAAIAGSYPFAYSLSLEEAENYISGIW